jgi:8-oxo-dGTP pyrophosphatase MutT (NUDIX family)
VLITAQTYAKSFSLQKNDAMNFSQKIYYNDKPIILTTDMEAYLDANPVAEMYTFFSGATLKSFTMALQLMDRPGSKGTIIEDVSEEALKEQLLAMYHPIQAGGGLVFNEQHALLMIFRRGKWDLPKGKLDAGEDIAECALREVIEETGLQHLELNGKLCDSYHIYMQDNEPYIKHTTWFNMKGAVADKLTPQKEENILEARWVTEKEIGAYASRTYEAIREVLKAGGLKW